MSRGECLELEKLAKAVAESNKIKLAPINIHILDTHETYQTPFDLRGLAKWARGKTSKEGAYLTHYGKKYNLSVAYAGVEYPVFDHPDDTDEVLNIRTPKFEIIACSNSFGGPKVISVESLRATEALEEYPLAVNAADSRCIIRRGLEGPEGINEETIRGLAETIQELIKR